MAAQLCGKGPVFWCQRWLGSTSAFVSCYPLGKHMAASVIYIVWGYIFHMPVLAVIGQTFTLRLYEALAKQERGWRIP